jgi:hypothetical protein
MGKNTKQEDQKRVHYRGDKKLVGGRERLAKRKRKVPPSREDKAKKHHKIQG